MQQRDYVDGRGRHDCAIFLDAEAWLPIEMGAPSWRDLLIQRKLFSPFLIYVTAIIGKFDKRGQEIYSYVRYFEIWHVLFSALGKIGTGRRDGTPGRDVSMGR